MAAVATRRPKQTHLPARNPPTPLGMLRILRLLARELNAMAPVPAVVVRDELRDVALREHGAVPDLLEEFHAIRVTRQYQPPLLRALLARRPT